MKNLTKIAHLQLTDGHGDNMTLLCNFVEGSIKYVLYEGHSSYGTKHSLAKLGLPRDMYLPIETSYDEETIEEFRERVIDMIQNHSKLVILRIVENQIKFFNYE